MNFGVYFHPSAIVNSAAMNIVVQRFSWVPGFNSLRAEFLDYMVILRLALWGRAKLFSMVDALFLIPISNAQGFQFLYILPTLVLFIKKKKKISQPDGCEVVSHCGFDLCLPSDYWCGTSLHVLLRHFCNFSGIMSIQFLCPFLNWAVYFAVVIELYLHYFWLKNYCLKCN